MNKRSKKLDRIKSLIKDDQLEKAYGLLTDLVSRKPQHIEAHVMLGDLCNTLGRPEEAYVYFLKIVTLYPEESRYIYKLGVTQRTAGKLLEAINLFQKALELNPDYLEALNSQGNIYFEIGHYDKAEENFLKIIKKKETAVGAHVNLAQVYRSRGKTKKAIFHLEKAINLNAADILPYILLSFAYLQACRQEDCIDVSKKAMEIDPSDSMSQQNYMFNMHYSSEIEKNEIFSAHIKWGNKNQNLEVKLLTNLPILKKRLRVGYVSSDLRRHSVGYFMKPIIKGHDRNVVEPYVYYNYKIVDKVTEEFIAMLPYSWRDIHTLTTQQAEDLIREDRIDILVDLSGHTSGNRLDLFKQRNVPVQITYLGYPDTTGLSTMDYRITDSFADPEKLADPFYSEQLLRIDPLFLCYDPPDDLPEIEHRKKEAAHSIVFGSFNASSKLSRRTLAVWSRLLCSDRSFSLVLKSIPFRDEEIAQDVKNIFQGYGVLPEQINIIGYTESMKEHFKLYNQVDIALDPFPYNGTTTTMEALVMGCPVVVLEGDRHSARVGGSILSSLGLHELIAKDEADYIKIAIELASDRNKIDEYKRTIRDRLMSSVLTDQRAFVRKLEDCYRGVWEKWCKEKELQCEEILLSKNVKVALPDEAGRKDVQLLVEHEKALPLLEEYLQQLPLQEKTVIDIGAQCGQRSLFFGQYAAKVVVYEPSSDLAAFIKMNITDNGCQNIDVLEAGLGASRQTRMYPYAISAHLPEVQDIRERYEFIIEVSLDEELEKEKFNSVGLIYIGDVGGMQAEIIQGAEKLLAEHSPMIIIENIRDESSQYKMVDVLLVQAGYEPFKFLPTLNILVPVQVSNNDSVYTIYCHTKKLLELSEKDLIIDDINHLVSTEEGCTYREAFWAEAGYVDSFKNLWTDEPDRIDANKAEYLEVLDLYIMVRKSEKTKKERYAYLLSSYTRLKLLCETAPTLPRLLSLARIAQDIDETQYAVGVLKLLKDLFESPDQLQIDEQFLAVSERFEKIDPKEDMGQWIFASILEALVVLHSPHFSKEESEQLGMMIQIIEDLGFGSLSLSKKKVFFSLADGIKLDEFPQDLLRGEKDYLNHEWWQRLSRKIL